MNDQREGDLIYLPHLKVGVTVRFVVCLCHVLGVMEHAARVELVAGGSTAIWNHVLGASREAPSPRIDAHLLGCLVCELGPPCPTLDAHTTALQRWSVAVIITTTANNCLYHDSI